MMATFRPQALVGRHVGLLNPPEFLTNRPGDARICRAVADPGRMGPVNGYPKAERGWGMGTNADDALTAAAMEAFERSCLGVGDLPAPVVATADELTARGVRYVAPKELARFTNEQYDSPGFPLNRPPKPTDEMGWVMGFDLSTGEAVALPWQFCVFAHGADDRHSDSEPMWVLPTSNGVGAGSSPFAACLSGLLELVERDAFAYMWYHQISLPHLEIPEGSPLADVVRRHFTDAGVEFRLVDLSSIHGIPAVAAIVWSRFDDKRIHNVGAAAGVSTAYAAWKAVLEAANLNPILRDTVGCDRGAVMEPDEVTSLVEQAEYFLDPRHLAPLGLLLDDRPSTMVTSEVAPELTGDPAAVLRNLTWRLHEESQLDVYAVDLTPPGYEHFGMCAYRVVCPRLLPLECGTASRQLAHPRLSTASDADRTSTAELNPHPFPLPGGVTMDDKTPTRQAVVQSWHRLRDESMFASDLAEEFHEASKFYELTVARQVHTERVFRDDELVASAATTAREKRHLPRRALPTETTAAQPEALVRPPSASSFRTTPVSVELLGRLLWLCYGEYEDCLPMGLGTHRAHRRPVASGGALYPLELYVLADLESVGTSTVYHYNPRRHGLEQVRSGLGPADLGRLANDPLVHQSPIVVLIAGLFHRSRFKYGSRGYRFTLIEAGAVVQQMQLAAKYLGLGSRPHAGVFDDAVEDLCDIDGVDESLINAVLIGYTND